MTLELVHDADEPTGEAVRPAPATVDKLLAELSQLAEILAGAVSIRHRFALVLTDDSGRAIVTGDIGREQLIRTLRQATAELCHDGEAVRRLVCPCADCDAERFERLHGRAQREEGTALAEIAAHLGMADTWSKPSDVVEALRAKLPATEPPPPSYTPPDGLPPWIDDDLVEDDGPETEVCSSCPYEGPPDDFGVDGVCRWCRHADGGAA